jgi:hypothetical protein
VTICKSTLQNSNLIMVRRILFAAKAVQAFLECYKCFESLVGIELQPKETLLKIIHMLKLAAEQGRLFPFFSGK